MLMYRNTTCIRSTCHIILRGFTVLQEYTGIRAMTNIGDFDKQSRYAAHGLHEIGEGKIEHD